MRKKALKALKALKSTKKHQKHQTAQRHLGKSTKMQISE